MKKLMKKAMLCLCALVMVAGLAACSGQSAGSEIGKYVFDSMEVNGVTITSEQISAMGAEEVTTYYVELKEGGKAKVYFASEGDLDGSYTLSGDKVNITIDGETGSFELKDGILSVEMDGNKINLKK